MYQQNAKDSLGETGKETFEAVNFLKQANPSQYKPENGAVYPATHLGRSLQQIAQLIKAGVGLEVAFTEPATTSAGTRTQTKAADAASLQIFFATFSQAIAAFATDLGKRMDDVVVLTMSEFGRTARENGGRGTDHGHANTMFVVGNSVKGGKVYGDFRGPKVRQAIRRPRPRRHDRFPRRLCRSCVQTQRHKGSREDVSELLGDEGEV